MINRDRMIERASDNHMKPVVLCARGKRKGERERERESEKRWIINKALLGWRGAKILALFATLRSSCSPSWKEQNRQSRGEINGRNGNEINVCDVSFLFRRPDQIRFPGITRIKLLENLTISFARIPLWWIPSFSNALSRSLLSRPTYLSGT